MREEKKRTRHAKRTQKKVFRDLYSSNIVRDTNISLFSEGQFDIRENLDFGSIAMRKQILA